MTEPKYTRRNPKPKKRRPSTLTIPDRAGPHVKLVFEEMRRQNITYDAVEQNSGVKRPALKAWRHKNYPNLSSIEAVLGCLGFEFVPIPTARVLSDDVQRELRPIATRLGLELPAAIRLAAEIAYRDHRLTALQAST